MAMSYWANVNHAKIDKNAGDVGALLQSAPKMCIISVLSENTATWCGLLVASASSLVSCTKNCYNTTK